MGKKFLGSKLEKRETCGIVFYIRIPNFRTLKSIIKKLEMFTDVLFTFIIMLY